MRDWQLAASPSYGASAFYWLAASLVAQDNSEELLAASCSWRRQISQLDKVWRGTRRWTPAGVAPAGVQTRFGFTSGLRVPNER